MNFKSVQIKQVNGSEITANISKALGDVLWNGAMNIAQSRLAQKIYDEEEVELTAEDKTWIKNAIKSRLNYAAQEAVISVLDSEPNKVD